MAYLRRLPSGRWQATVRLPDGRRATYTAALKGEAREWGAEQERRIRTGTWRDPRTTRVTLREWWSRWYAARIVEERTTRGEQAAVQRVLDRFGSHPIGSIGRMEVQGWVSALHGAGVGPAAIWQAHKLLATCMAAAADEGVIPASPCRRITLPRMDPPPVHWFSRDQVDAIRAQLQEPYRTMATLMCWVGLRWGEAAGLRVCDVDWMRSRLTIVGALDGNTGRWKEHPKNTASRAEVPVPPWLIEDMSRLVAGRPRDALIFLSQRGKSLRYPNWNLIWHRALEAAGVPYLPPHACRHTAASWLVQAGVPLYEVARQLRHKTITHTQRYAHLAPDVHAPVTGAWEAMTHPRRMGDGRGTSDQA